MEVGFIGLGIMGREMAQHLIDKGYKVTVWNRSPEILTSFREKKIKIAENLHDLANQSSLIISCVSNEKSLEEVYLSKKGVLTAPASKLQNVVDCSTVSPAFVRYLASQLNAKNIKFSDAPITGGDVGAKNGTLTTMVGADEADYEKILPLLSTFSKNVYHMGEVGSGQEAKCVNQIAIASSVAAMTESLFFCEQKGLPIDKMLSILQNGSAGSWAFSNYAPRVLQGDMAPGFYARDMLKDIRIVLKEAEESYTPLPVTAILKELYTSLISKKGDQLGNHALIEIYRELVNSKKSD